MNSKKIMIIGRDQNAAHSMTNFLQQCGYETSELLNPTIALPRLRREKPDLVLMELDLLDIDGRNLIQAIRADAGMVRLPIIVCSDRASESDVARGLDLGADDYMPKPVNLRELSARVSALLRRCSRRSEADCRNTGESSRR